MIVIDASVAVKWFLPEQGEEAAQQLLGGVEPLFAPALIRMEVASAILRRFHEEEIQEGKAHAILAAWESLLANRIVRLVDEAELFDVAVALAFICGHTLADCFYLAAAKSLDATLVTADAGLRDRGTQAYAKITTLAGCSTDESATEGTHADR